MNTIDELTLTVVLGKLEVHTELAGHGAKPSFDVGERLRTVQSRLSNPKQVEVWSVEDGDPHVFLSPSSHALNCWISSSGLPLGVPGWSAGALLVRSLALWEKNWSKENAGCARSPAFERSRKT